MSEIQRKIPLIPHWEINSNSTTETKQSAAMPSTTHKWHELQFCVTTVTSDTWPSRCPSQRHPLDDDPHHRPSRWRHGWSTAAGVDLTLMLLHAAIFFTKSISANGDLPMPIYYVLTCSNVADFWCPMCTSAELISRYGVSQVPCHVPVV